jgi:hypothetical protein
VGRRKILCPSIGRAIAQTKPALPYFPISFLGLGEAIPPLAKLVPTNSTSIYRRNRLIFHVAIPYSIANVVTQLTIAVTG